MSFKLRIGITNRSFMITLATPVLPEELEDSKDIK